VEINISLLSTSQISDGSCGEAASPDMHISSKDNTERYINIKNNTDV
jgi:hypothetical protein